MDGFNTFEKQDKVLLGLNSGRDAAAALRILQQQGFAVQTFTAENAVTPAELLRLLADKAAELDCAFIATGHYAQIEVDSEGLSRRGCRGRPERVAGRPAAGDTDQTRPAAGGFHQSGCGGDACRSSGIMKERLCGSFRTGAFLFGFAFYRRAYCMSASQSFLMGRRNTVFSLSGAVLRTSER